MPKRSTIKAESWQRGTRTTRNALPAGPVEPGVHVRDARPDELARIGDLRVAAYVADGFLSAASGYADMLRRLGADGGGDILVAVDGTAILGTVMLQAWPGDSEVAVHPGEAEIRALAVAPDARGRGIGRVLLAEVTQRARDRGIGHLLLLTLPQMRAAQHLYTQAGFGRLPKRDTTPAPGITLLAYGLRLAP